MLTLVARMSVEVHWEKDIPVVVVNTDKLTASLSPTLKALYTKMVIDEGQKYIVTSLEKVDLVDSAGLSALLAGHRLCRDAGGALVLYGVKGYVEKVIHISQLHHVFHIVANKEAALDYVIMAKMEEQLSSGGGSRSE